MYARPRVWAECFHSSGWGATPDQLMAATNSAFALGANLINLHGLYASTRASWWEWAPPDFHFRQPYWACMDVYGGYVARVSWLMSQGTKRGDVAILYPTIALAGGLNPAVSPDAGPTAYSEQQRGEALPKLDAAELNAFSLAQALFNEGVDVDFIDDHSVESAAIADGVLRAGNGEWPTIILTDMSSIRLETLQRLRDLKASGGRVVLVGSRPVATNSNELTDEDLRDLIASLANEQFDGLDGASPDRLVPPRLRGLRSGALQVVRRRIADDDIYLLHNASHEAFHDEVVLSGSGTLLRLDPKTGLETACHHIAESEDALRFALALEPQHIAIFRVSRLPATEAEHTHRKVEGVRGTVSTMVLDGPWTYALMPTMDNRYRDFAGDSATIGLEINRLRWRENEASEWAETAAGYAPRYLMLGPVPTDAELDDWIAKQSSVAIDACPAPLMTKGRQLVWRECMVSRENGILDDPWLKHWACGPHGLKDQVPEDYIDCGENTGEGEHIICGVISAEASSIIISSQAAYSLWIDGRLAVEQPDALLPQTIPPWNLPTYKAPVREARVTPGTFHRFALRLRQPHTQRLRAHLGISGAPEPDGRAQRFLADSRFSIQPAASSQCPPQFYQFDAPPGATAFTLQHRGRLAATRAGQALSVETSAAGDGLAMSRVTGGQPSDPAGPIELRLDDTDGLRAGDAVFRIIFENSSGTLEIGDWSQQGLAPYSGGVRYTATVDLPDGMDEVVLQTGEVGSCCEITVNGRCAGKLICAPWQIDISEHAKPGDNSIEISVFNTLANHFVENTPSALSMFIIPYVALGFEIAPAYDDRPRLQSVRWVCNMAANFAGPALAWTIFFKDGLDQSGKPVTGTSIADNYTAMGLWFAGAIILLTAAMLWGCRHSLRDTRGPLPDDAESIGRHFISSFVPIFKDPNALRIICCVFVLVLGMVIASSVQGYLYVHLLHLSGVQRTTVHASTMVASALGAAISPYLVSRFDKKGAIFFGCASGVIGKIAMLLWMYSFGYSSNGTASIVSFAFFDAVYWLASGIVMPVATAMIGDLGNIAGRKAGRSLDGSYSSVLSLSWRVGVSVRPVSRRCWRAVSEIAAAAAHRSRQRDGVSVP